ncbi:hypothetical protein GB937_002491 [Aspergillus fischeri]|nr:hypothetical protein GB937_002491 [Aspergillus fischeri]
MTRQPHNERILILQERVIANRASLRLLQRRTRHPVEHYTYSQFALQARPHDTSQRPTVAKLLTHTLHLLRRRIRLPQQRLNHLRQEIVAIAIAVAALARTCTCTPTLRLPSHNLQRLSERIERGAYVARNRDGMRSGAVLIGADLGEGRKEG